VKAGWSWIVQSGANLSQFVPSILRLFWFLHLNPDSDPDTPSVSPLYLSPEEGEMGTNLYPFTFPP
jgi:hypothetical protein